MSKSLIILIIIAVFFGGIFWVVSKNQIDDIKSDSPFYVKKIIKKTIQIEIDEIKIEAEVAKSEKDKIKGLSGRTRLVEDKGMLFVFDEPGIYEMTMSGMKFSIDAIWILDDKVVDLTENVKYPSIVNLEEPVILKPRFEANYVLEVSKNFVVENGIEIGMPVKMDLTDIK